MNIVIIFLKEIGFDMQQIIFYFLIITVFILILILIIGLIIDQIKHGGNLK